MTLGELFANTDLAKDTTRVHVTKKRDGRIETARSGRWYEDGILGLCGLEIRGMSYDGGEDRLTVEV